MVRQGRQGAGRFNGYWPRPEQDQDRRATSSGSVRVITRDGSEAGSCTTTSSLAVAGQLSDAVLSFCTQNLFVVLC